MNDTLTLIFIIINVSVLHTLLGPDHYLPTAAIARAQGWHWRKTLTVVCSLGTGHVLVSFLLGLAGVAGVQMLQDYEIIQEQRGAVAAYALVALGAIYVIAALRAQARKWVAGSVPLIAIFLIGPCEPLIPLMFTSPIGAGLSVVVIAGLYALLTVMTMSIAVFSAMSLAHVSARIVPGIAARLGIAELYGLAGATLIGCGLAMEVLGL